MSFCLCVFMVKTLRLLVLPDAQQSGLQSVRNVFLLVVAAVQFLFCWFLGMWVVGDYFVILSFFFSILLFYCFFLFIIIIFLFLFIFYLFIYFCFLFLFYFFVFSLASFFHLSHPVLPFFSYPKWTACAFKKINKNQPRKQMMGLLLVFVLLVFFCFFFVILFFGDAIDVYCSSSALQPRNTDFQAPDTTGGIQGVVMRKWSVWEWPRRWDCLCYELEKLATINKK